MPAPRLPWFRIWMDATTHEKVRQLDDGQFRTWVELLDAASKQTIRGRFASRASAVSLVRRPAAHVAALINARLIDEDADKRLTMHDWDEWQRWRKEDLNGSSTPPDHPPNDSRTSTERPPNGHMNDSPTTTASATEQLTKDESLRVRAAAPVRREERREKRDRDIDEDVDVRPPAPAERPPTQISKPTKIRRPISNETIERLVAEYGPRFGDEAVVRDWITRALNHTARLKCLDEALYVERTWLKPELAKLKARSDTAPIQEMAETIPVSAEANRAFQNCTRCGIRRLLVVSTTPLCGACADITVAA